MKLSSKLAIINHYAPKGVIQRLYFSAPAKIKSFAILDYGPDRYKPNVFVFLTASR